VEIALLSILTMAASFIAGVAGFGYAVFLMSFFPLILDIKTANVLVSLSGMAITIYMFIPLRQYIGWGIVARVLVGMAFGIPAGMWILVKMDEQVLTIALGAFILLYILYELLHRRREGKSTPVYLGYGAGFLGGAFAGSISAGGPPVVAYLSALDLDKYAAKASIVAYVLITSFYKLLFLVYLDLITRKIALYTAFLIMPSFVGMFIGKAVFNRLSSEMFRRVVLGILFSAAVIIIFKALGGR
jgi:uncharacterized membrane protein YfcA